MIRFIMILLCCILSVLQVFATIVIDSESGKPLSKASIFDRKGNIVGVSSDLGLIPSVETYAYPLTIRYMGYADAVVETSEIDKVLLTKVPISLPEVVVESKKKEVLHITGYLREFSTLSTYSDTVFLFREKTVDFMVPTKRAKGFEGWLKPRLLASRSYYRFTDSQGADSVSNHFRRHFSWSDWLGIFNNVSVPSELSDSKITTDTIYGKFSPSVIWRKNDDSFTVDVDLMADKNNLQWMPGMFNLFGSKVEFTKFDIRYFLEGVNADGIFADNISRITFNVESKGRGNSLLNSANPLNRGPEYVNTYAEIYITDIEYVSVRDARRIEKKPATATETGISAPSDAPELHPAVMALVDRVDSFDYDGHRLVEKADERLAGKEIPDHYVKPDKGIKKILKTIIKDNVWPREGMQGRFILGR